MLVLSFDQALNTSGYAVFEDGLLVNYDKFTTSDATVSEKLCEIRANAIELIDNVKPNIILIEEIQLQQIPGSTQHGNVETFKKLAYVQATLMVVAQEKGIEYKVIPSSVWKSTLGIRGRARAEQKRNAQKFVLDTFGVRAIQDICDSICIGEHYMRETKKEINWG